MPGSEKTASQHGTASRPGTSMTHQTSLTSNSLMTWMTRGGMHRMGRGELLYTGPGGKTDHQVRTFSQDELREVGIGDVSAEKSSELLYLYRPAEGSQFPTPKAAEPGAIGWGLPLKGDPRTWPVHMQIKSEQEFKETLRNADGIWKRR